jgi:hypothetical protein
MASSRTSPPRAAADDAAERWAVDAGAADVAMLDIPASARHERVFDIDVRFVVRVPDPAAGAWHALSVDLDGARQWSRRLASANPGQTDSLDYHCRRSVGVGQALRVRAAAQAGGAARLQLLIEAEEVPRR